MGSVSERSATGRSGGVLGNGKATVNQADHLHPTCRAMRGVAGGRCRRAFSLLDVLVSLAVIMVLLSIMLPSLTHVREVARRVVCGSNMHNIHLGIVMYANDENDNIPDSMFLRGQSSAPQEMITLYSHFKSGHRNTGWDGIGKLFAGNYLSVEGVYYCPSHKGEHTQLKYADAWANPRTGMIAGNYHYRGRGANGKTVLSEIHPDSAALLADSMRTRDDWNHEIGTNVVRADGSVFWYQGGAGWIIEKLPGDGKLPQTPSAIRGIWLELDRGPK